MLEDAYHGLRKRAATTRKVVDGRIEGLCLILQVCDIILHLSRVTLDRRAKGGQGKDERHERGMEEHGIGITSDRAVGSTFDGG